MLLHLLARDPAWRALGVRAIHVDHGLHPDARRWAAHCRDTCEAFGVHLDIVTVDVDPAGGRGPEASAREARYRAFEAALGKDETLVLAHHQDDQAETFLLRALRGSGPDGLAAMRAWRAFAHAWLWRPLLDVPRSALLAHARACELGWTEDPSNGDGAFDRNFLRLRVLPLLRERWPHASQAFARSAALSAEASALLSSDDARLLDTLQAGSTTTLGVEGLRALPSARRGRVLRAWIEALSLPPLPAQGVERIEHDLLDSASGTKACFGWSGVVVRRWRERLHAARPCDPLPRAWEVSWDGRSPLPLPGGGRLRLVGADAFDAPMRATARRGGERIVLPGRSHSHALKHLLQEASLPPWERARLPLLWATDGALLAAGDIVVSARLHAWLDAQGARLHWAKP